jgi:hypothetical protein
MSTGMNAAATAAAWGADFPAAGDAITRSESRCFGPLLLPACVWLVLLPPSALPSQLPFCCKLVLFVQCPTHSTETETTHSPTALNTSAQQGSGCERHVSLRGAVQERG